MLRLLALAAAIALVGCAPKLTSGGIVVYERYWERAVDELRYQASIDLHCDAEEIQFTLASKQGKIPTRIYAQGCGGRALYARRLRRSGMRGKYTDRNTTWEQIASDARGRFGEVDDASHSTDGESAVQPSGRLSRSSGSMKPSPTDKDDERLRELRGTNRSLVGPVIVTLGSAAATIALVGFVVGTQGCTYEGESCAAPPAAAAAVIAPLATMSLGIWWWRRRNSVRREYQRLRHASPLLVPAFGVARYGAALSLAF